MVRSDGLKDCILYPSIDYQRNLIGIRQKGLIGLKYGCNNNAFGFMMKEDKLYLESKNSSRFYPIYYNTVVI